MTGSVGSDVLRRDLVHAGQPHEAHRADELVFENFEHAHHARLASRGQAPRLQATQRDDVGAHARPP